MVQAVNSLPGRVCEVGVPPVVASPARFERVRPLGRCRYARFGNFLKPEVAEAVHNELARGLRYERVDIGGITQLWRGQRELGDAYFGELLTRTSWRRSAAVQACYDLFSHPWLESVLSRLMGTPISFMRPATPYRMGDGDRICLHDDLSDPAHRVAVVLNLSKDWRRDFGGNTIVGQVSRIEDLPTPAEVPFQLRRWYLTRFRSVLTPRFNSLLVIAIEKGMAHGVTPVKVARPRLSLVSIFGHAGATAFAPD